MVCAVAATADPIRTPIAIRFFIRILPLSFSMFYDGKIGEVSQTVRFGPQACLPRLTESLIFRLEQTVPVQKHREQIIFESNPQRVPSAAGDLVLDAVRSRGQAL